MANPPFTALFYAVFSNFSHFIYLVKSVHVYLNFFFILRLVLQVVMLGFRKVHTFHMQANWNYSYKYETYYRAIYLNYRLS